MGNLANFQFTAALPVFNLASVLPGTAVHLSGGSRLEGTFYEGNGIVTSVSPLNLTVELYDTFLSDFETKDVTLDAFNSGAIDIAVLTIEDGTGSEETGAKPLDRTPPAEVTSVITSSTDTTATVTFTVPADVDYDHVVIYRNDEIIIPELKSNTFTDVNLPAETIFNYKIRTVDKVGNPSVGYDVSVTTQETPDTTPPGTVTNLLAFNIGATTAELVFDSPNDSDFSFVTIYENSTVIVDNLLDSYYELVGLTPATSYTYKVVASDSSGNKSVPSEVTFTTTA